MRMWYEKYMIWLYKVPPKKIMLAIFAYANQHCSIFYNNIIHIMHGGDYTDLHQKLYTQAYSYGQRYVNHINYLQIYTFE